MGSTSKPLGTGDRNGDTVGRSRYAACDSLNRAAGGARRPPRLDEPPVRPSCDKLASNSTFHGFDLRVSSCKPQNFKQCIDVCGKVSRNHRASLNRNRTQLERQTRRLNGHNGSPLATQEAGHKQTRWTHSITIIITINAKSFEKT